MKEIRGSNFPMKNQGVCVCVWQFFEDCKSTTNQQFSCQKWNWDGTETTVLISKTHSSYTNPFPVELLFSTIIQSIQEFSSYTNPFPVESIV